MPASASSVADIVNIALARIGYQKRVANLYDGSAAANRALDIYGQTRDDLLRDGDWHFCQRMVNATLLKTAPDNYFDTPWDPATHPPQPWLFEYEYPGDCIKVRRMSPQPGFFFNPTPQPTLNQTYNDSTYAGTRRVILCNIPSAILTYAGQVTNPSTMPPDFIEALAAELSVRLKPALVGSVDQVNMVDVQRQTASAAEEQG